MVMTGKIRVSDRTAEMLRGKIQTPARSLTKLEPLPADIKVNIPTRQVEALAAVFDLSGYTTFCSQATPPTMIPAFLDRFLEWLFLHIEKGTNASEPLWKEPPFFAKFLGDGVLVLWDTGHMVDRQIAGLITRLSGTGGLYRSEFIPKLTGIKFPPQSLRCRIARGTVFSVNNGRDYVGHCINLAVHLQRYRLISLCIAADGLNSDCFDFSLVAQLTRLSVPVKGLRADQPVLVIRKEVEALQKRPG